MNNFIFENVTKTIFGKGCIKEYFAWGIPAEGKSQEELARAGVEALADLIKEIGLPTTLRELEIDETMDLKMIANSCNLVPESYKEMTHEEILEIFRECI